MAKHLVGRGLCGAGVFESLARSANVDWKANMFSHDCESVAP